MHKVLKINLLLQFFDERQIRFLFIFISFIRPGHTILCNSSRILHFYHYCNFLDDDFELLFAVNNLTLYIKHICFLYVCTGTLPVMKYCVRQEHLYPRSGTNLRCTYTFTCTEMLCTAGALISL